MHAAALALALAALLLLPAGTAAVIRAPSDGIRPIIAGVQGDDPASVNVYDYTRIGTPWTPLIIATVDEFNAIRPPTAPQLVYVAGPGDTECLDLPNDVLVLPGIVVCDTSRPEDFPYDPNAPPEGWRGNTQHWEGSTTTVIALNSFVPEGFHLREEAADHVVCHEMMHAYTRIHDDYDSDPFGSCVWGNLLVPGPTDIRLMWERYPQLVEEPSLLERARGVGQEVQEWACDSMSHFDMSFLWDDTRSRTRQVRDRVREVLPDVDVDVPGVDVEIPEFDVPGIDFDIPDGALPRCKGADDSSS